MGLWTYLGSALLVLVVGFGVFRVIVRRDYLRHGRLTLLSSLLQYAAIGAWVCFGCLNIPGGWPDVQVGVVQEMVGWALLTGGWLVTLIGIVHLGIRRSHGLRVDSLRRTGMYGLTRNPQAAAFLAAMIGYLVLWPTWRNVGVLILVVVLAHFMILSEEEHLREVFGDEYMRYGKEVPRYLKLPRSAFDSRR